MGSPDLQNSRVLPMYWSSLRLRKTTMVVSSNSQFAQPVRRELADTLHRIHRELCSMAASFSTTYKPICGYYRLVTTPLQVGKRCRMCTDTRPVFQQTDVTESTHHKHGTTLRLFGVTSKGNSVLAHIWGFRPYFYVAAPSGFLEDDLEAFKDKINVRHISAPVC
jgi:hypothetical protein